MEHCRVSGPFAVSAPRVFDGQRALVDHAVVMEHGRVSGVLPRAALPQDIPCRHESRCTILPGMIDTHVHFMHWQGPQFLAYGVTTVRDVGNDLRWILDCRAQWPTERWPRILCLGPLLDGPTPVHELVGRRCTDLTTALDAINETAAQGVDGLKFYVGPPPSWLPTMIERGHASGLKVSMHCAGSVIGAAQVGLDEFYHLDGILADVWPDHPAGWLDLWGLDEFAQTKDEQHRVADSISQSGITATPTLAYWDSQWRIRTPGAMDLHDVSRIPSSLVTWQAAPPDAPAGERWRRALDAAQRFVGLLLERGVQVLAGTDVPCGPVPPGQSLWNELSLLVEAGMSPVQALRAATSEAATFLGRPELGFLHPGSVADMVLVEGNPLERIPARPGIAAVVRGGVFYQPEALLAPSATSNASLEDEPWARQFERHWAKRAMSHADGHELSTTRNEVHGDPGST